MRLTWLSLINSQHRPPIGKRALAPDALVATRSRTLLVGSEDGLSLAIGRQPTSFGHLILQHLQNALESDPSQHSLRSASIEASQFDPEKVSLAGKGHGFDELCGGRAGVENVG